MEENFWHQRWSDGAIGFHLDAPNPLLVAYFDELRLPKGSRVFLPLCGKTVDCAWLLARGYTVAGAELSRIAIDALFEALNIQPIVEVAGPLLHYRGPGIDIFVGNIFDLTADILGSVDAVYDRAALVALPPAMRDDYTKHLVAISKAAPQLLIAFEYDQRQIAGPPFSIDGAEVKWHYESRYHLRNVETRNVEGGLKGLVPAVESVWVLSERGA